jgi:integrase/recombinase XerD
MGLTMRDIRILEFKVYCKEQLGLSSHSLRAYVQDLQSFVRYASDAEIAIPPSSEQLVQYHRYLRETAGSSAATIRRRFVTLRSYFRWVEEECGGERSPFQGLRLELKVPRRLPRPIDRPTLDVLFRSSRSLTEIDPTNSEKTMRQGSPDQVTGLVTRLLVVTGLRIGEITNLRINDVAGACSQMRVRGKGNRERTVYVTNARLLEDFRCYWQKAKRERFLKPLPFSQFTRRTAY